MKLSLKQRIVLRLLGVKLSEDGTRWTAPRKHAEMIERAFRSVVDEAWRKGDNVSLTYDAGGGMTVCAPKGTITLRWLP